MRIPPTRSAPETSSGEQSLDGEPPWRGRESAGPDTVNLVRPPHGASLGALRCALVRMETNGTRHPAAFRRRLRHKLRRTCNCRSANPYLLWPVGPVLLGPPELPAVPRGSVSPDPALPCPCRSCTSARLPGIAWLRRARQLCFDPRKLTTAVRADGERRIGCQQGQSTGSDQIPGHRFLQGYGGNDARR